MHNLMKILASLIIVLVLVLMTIKKQQKKAPAKSLPQNPGTIVIQEPKSGPATKAVPLKPITEKNLSELFPKNETNKKMVLPKPKPLEPEKKVKVPPPEPGQFDPKNLKLPEPPPKKEISEEKFVMKDGTEVTKTYNDGVEQTIYKNGKYEVIYECKDNPDGGKSCTMRPK